MSLKLEDNKARLHIIGSGTPTPTRHRFGSCLVLCAAGRNMMFDCGPATTYKLACLGMLPTDVTHLFFTHHHYDHNADYPCFLLCRWDHERKDLPRLKVYGPPPTDRITRQLIGPNGAFADDWRVRIEHPASREVYAARGGTVPRPEPDFEVREIFAGETIDLDPISVRAERAVHLDPIMMSLSYRIEWDGYAVVITGDTARHPGIDRLAVGADMLIVNVWDHQSKMSGALTSGFCGTMDAAGMAQTAGAARLVITHQGSGLCHPESRAKAIADMAGVFHGEIVFGEEFMTLKIPEE